MGAHQSSPSPVLCSRDIINGLHELAPEAGGKMSGEFAEAIGAEIPTGGMHDPLFDVRSILSGVKHLVETRETKNPFMID